MINDSIYCVLEYAIESHHLKWTPIFGRRRHARLELLLFFLHSNKSIHKIIRTG